MMTGRPIDPTDQEKAELRERAIRVLDKLGESQLERPIFVEFAGSPKSGKSTCIDIVAHFFRRTGFRVLAPTEGASKRTPYYLKNDLVAFNAWSAAYALHHVLEGLYHSDKHHISILDRGLFDALAWFELLSSQQPPQIDQETRDRIHKFLLVEKWRSVIDSVLLFRADPATSMDRENRDKLISDPGRAMNPDFLQSLNDAYDRVHGRYNAEFPRLVRIDTSQAAGTSPTSTASQAAGIVLDLFEQRIA